MNLNNIVCRTCLGIISEGKVAHNIDEENGLIRYVRNIREMITFCVPEMDLFISVSPVICESCLGILVSVYNFKIRCLRVENAILSYIKSSNVMEGSCVNLNNVVRKQIIEALQQKRWPAARINDYVDKHLCMATTPQASSPGRLFHAMAENFNEPQLLNNPSPRPPIRDVFEPPAPANICSKTPPAATTNSLSLHGIQNSRYLRVSKNLMPSGIKDSPQTEKVKDLSLNIPPMIRSPRSVVPNNIASVSLQSQATTLSPTNLNEFQQVFLSALQLTSSASGGREEAVLIKKKEMKKRTVRSSKKLLGSQNFIPPGGSKASNCSNPAQNLLKSNGKSTGTVPTILCPVTGLLQKRLNVEVDSRSSKLRKVRKSVISNVGNNKNNASCMENSDVIILDNDTDMVIQKVGDETLMMNFDENADNFVNNEVSGSPIIVDTTPSVAKFNKHVFVRLPMIDKETLKRKLAPENVIDEILSKRRKLVVKLNSSLPYLHKNKKLIVKLPRQTFYLCTFCKFVDVQEKRLQEHYMNSHKVCAICNFKCDRSVSMTKHINKDHPLELKETLNKYSKGKTEFHCHLCPFTGLSEVDLRDHRLRIHIKCNISGMYKCPSLNCDKESPIAYVICKHIETVHDKLKQTACALCSHVATCTYALKRHVQSHSMDKQKCHFCCFTSKTSFSLSVHLKNKHSLTQSRNTTGMVYTRDLTGTDETNFNSDYRVTLNTLQSGATGPRQTTAVNEFPDDQNVDLDAYSMPSLSEMLCVTTFTEEPSDQENDCTIVSESQSSELPELLNKRPESGEKSKRNSGNSESVDDPNDCMIVVQEIPTVDLSNEDTIFDTAKRRQENHSDVIEIEDHNDDWPVLSNNMSLTAESSTHESNDAVIQRATDDSETDTCSEALVSPVKKSDKSAAGSDTDPSGTCSELSAGDVLSRKSGSEKSGSKTDESQKIILQDHTDAFVHEETNIMNNPAEEAKVVEDSLTCMKQSTGNKGLIHKTSIVESNTLGNKDADLITDKSTANSSNNIGKDSACDSSEVSKNSDTFDKNKHTNSSKQCDQNVDPHNKETLDAVKILEQILGQRSSDSSEPGNTQELIIPEIISLESVLIESSDEDSNDCMFVSEINTIENASGSEMTKHQQKTSEIVINETPIEKNVSKASEGSNIDNANKTESQNKSEMVFCNTLDKASCEKNDDNTSVKADKNEKAPIVSIEKPDRNKPSEESINKSYDTVFFEPSPDSTDNLMSKPEESSEPQSKDGIERNEETTNTVSEMGCENLEISGSSQKVTEKNHLNNLETVGGIETNVSQKNVSMTKNIEEGFIVKNIEKDVDVDLENSASMDLSNVTPKNGTSDETNTSSQDSYSSGEVQPVANYRNISKDNLVQLACADSTVLDCSESVNVISGDSESTLNALNSTEDESDKGIDNNKEDKVVSSYNMETEEVSEKMVIEKTSNVEGKDDQVSIEVEEIEKSVDSLSFVPNSDIADSIGQGENNSNEKIVVSKLTDPETINKDLNLHMAKE